MYVDMPQVQQQILREINSRCLSYQITRNKELHMDGRKTTTYFPLSSYYLYQCVSIVNLISFSPPLSICSICLFAPLGEDQVPSVWSCELSCGTLCMGLSST